MSNGSTTETRGRRRKATTEDVYQAIQAAERPFLSTRQITEKVGDVSKPTILDRLRTLNDEGRVLSHEVANGMPVWYLSEPKENGAFESAISHDDELRSAVDEIREDDETDAAVVRRLLNEAFDARERSVLDEIDARETLRSAVEDAREGDETDAAVVRRLLKDAGDARRADALDAIGADEELRTVVEGVREDREPLEDAVRRVVRSGVVAEQEDTLAELAYRRARSLEPIVLTGGVLSLVFVLSSVVIALFPSLGTVPAPVYPDLGALVDVFSILFSFAFVIFFTTYVLYRLFAYVTYGSGIKRARDLPLIRRVFRRLPGAASS